jgi:hypothetical protein
VNLKLKFEIFQISFKKLIYSRRKNVIGRVFFVHPLDIDRFYLRQILLYKKGATSFEDLRKINNIQYDSYKDAAVALGIAEDDKEWIECLQEITSKSTNPKMLRELFVMIMLHCAPTNPAELWHKFKDFMCEDILYEFRQAKNDPNLQCDGNIHNIGLSYLDNILNKNGKKLQDIQGMPNYSVDEEFQDIFNQSSLVLEELNYNTNKMIEELNADLPKLNVDQKLIFDSIIKRVTKNQIGNNVFFIDGPGGTGKTFVYKTILNKLRSESKIALAVASSGIAALLLPGGRTAHSRLKIPFCLSEISTCNIKLQSQEAQLLKKAKLILWDECPMMSKQAFEALDRSLRDIMSQVNPNFKTIPFGNKIILFGGDFRQILPVVKKGSESDIVNASFNRSYLWKNINIFKLKTNMRVQRLITDNNSTEATEAQEFSNYLLSIGEGREKTFEFK